MTLAEKIEAGRRGLSESVPLGDCESARVELRCAEVRRTEDGLWYLDVVADVEIVHPDGRRLRFNGRRAFRGMQQGRRPYPKGRRRAS